MNEASRFLLFARADREISGRTGANVLRSLPFVASVEPPTMATINGLEVRILDSISAEGPILVEMNAEVARALSAPDSLLKVAPVILHKRPSHRLIRPRAKGGGLAGTRPITVTCRDAGTGRPIIGALVLAFDDFAGRTGAEGLTDFNGQAVLSFYSPSRIERLDVETGPRFWGANRKDLPYADHAISIEPVRLASGDGIRYYYPVPEANVRFDPNAGIVVGVIDTGVGPHTDLNVEGGYCTVIGQPSNAFGDVEVHGTLVAGVIGARGNITGIAPGVRLRSYRVFPDEFHDASNAAILKAVERAAMDRCDILNLSLGDCNYDPVLDGAIKKARDSGMLVVVAAGNDWRGVVRFPASHPDAVAVSAMGRIGTFPVGSLADGDIELVPGSSVASEEFIAAFSNVGPEIDVVAPGVGSVSTLPNDEYGQLSGTSMATPVATGMAACLLSHSSAIIGMNRNRARSDAIERLLRTNCVQHGFGVSFEGSGRPK